MRKLLLAALVGLVVALHGPVGADGPSGSSETGNEVTCNRNVGQTNGGVNVGAEPAGNWVFVGPGGIETCSDDGIPLDGRVVVSTQGYVTTDGDASNAPVMATGCIRIGGGEATGPGGAPTGCGADNDGTE